MGHEEKQPAAAGRAKTRPPGAESVGQVTGHGPDEQIQTECIGVMKDEKPPAARPEPPASPHPDSVKVEGRDRVRVGLEMEQGACRD